GYYCETWDNSLNGPVF
nr:immunoglobulin light chain junction region [Macaca mulatta]MOW00352.1 immunoglobulin light chain junction region [Macaca mulatta]MOW01330.1 immunoglobulin light chain junction region [Macaca mulatta]